MASFLSSWAQQIIFAVIIGIIIQMLLPEGKNKKYVKMCIGIYVLFTIISPVVGKKLEVDLNELNLNINNNINYEEKNTSENINEIYTTNLKQDIIAKLDNKGYGCKNLKIETDENYNVKLINIEEIYIKKEEKKSVNTVVINEVKIGEKENSIKEQIVKGISQSKEKDLKRYLSETYNVKEENIKIT